MLDLVRFESVAEPRHFLRWKNWRHIAVAVAVHVFGRRWLGNPLSVSEELKSSDWSTFIANIGPMVGSLLGSTYTFMPVEN